MKAIGALLAIALIAAVVLGVYWLIWSAYMFALVPHGAPAVTYWQACAALFLLATVAGIVRGARK